MADHVDLFAQVQQIRSDLGNAQWAKVGEGIQGLMDGLIEEAGNLLGAAVTKGPGMLMGAIAKGGAAISGTMSNLAPYNPNFSRSPDATPEVARAPEIEAPSRGLGREIASANDVSAADLGNFSPPATPSQGVRQSQGISV